MRSFDFSHLNEDDIPEDFPEEVKDFLREKLRNFKEFSPRWENLFGSIDNEDELLSAIMIATERFNEVQHKKKLAAIANDPEVREAVLAAMSGSDDLPTSLGDNWGIEDIIGRKDN